MNIEQTQDNRAQPAKEPLKNHGDKLEQQVERAVEENSGRAAEENGAEDKDD
jgi:hypothetical protein